MAEILNISRRESTRTRDAFIEFAAVGKTFATKTGDRVEAIRDISFSVGKDQFATIVGPSGCGKSTLLKMLAGLLAPSTGRISVNAEGADPLANVGMVFQRPALLPWRNVLANILLPAVITGMDREVATNRAYELLKLVGLEDFATRYPNELSGGMQQRVGICRALLCHPTLLLMDEPFAALDAMTREDLSVELMRIWQHEPKTVLFVTHSISEAILLADQVVIISSRPGRVVRTVDIEIRRPRDLATMLTPAFQDYMALIRSSIGESH